MADNPIKLTRADNRPCPLSPTTGHTPGVTNDPQRSAYAQRVMPTQKLVSDVAQSAINASTMLNKK
jgi:hypothetical protein